MKVTNFKPKKKLKYIKGVGERMVLDTFDKSFFFGGRKGHGKKIKSVWNNLSTRSKNDNQVDSIIIAKCMGLKRK